MIVERAGFKVLEVNCRYWETLKYTLQMNHGEAITTNTLRKRLHNILTSSGII